MKPIRTSILQRQRLLQLAHEGHDAFVSELVPIHVEAPVVTTQGDFMSALQLVAERHGSLRTIFDPGLNEVDRAHITDDVSIDLVSPREQRSRSMTADVFGRSRILLQSGTNDLRTQFVAGIDHMVCDGISARIVADEVAEILCGRAPGGSLPTQMSDWSDRQWTYAESPSPMTMTYWRNTFEDTSVVPRLQFSNADGGVGRAAQIRTSTTSLGEDAAEIVERCARHAGVTQFSLLLALAARSFSVVQPWTQMVIQTLWMNRRSKSSRGVVGFLAHSLPLALDLADDEDVCDAARRTAGLFGKAVRHGDLPFPVIREMCDVKRDDELTIAGRISFAYVDARPRQINREGWTQRFHSSRVDPTHLRGGVRLTVIRNAVELQARLDWLDEVHDESAMRAVSEQFSSEFDGLRELVS